MDLLKVKLPCSGDLDLGETSLEPFWLPMGLVVRELYRVEAELEDFDFRRIAIRSPCLIRPPLGLMEKDLSL